MGVSPYEFLQFTEDPIARRQLIAGAWSLATALNKGKTYSETSRSFMICAHLSENSMFSSAIRDLDFVISVESRGRTISFCIFSKKDL